MQLCFAADVLFSFLSFRRPGLISEVAQWSIDLSSTKLCYTRLMVIHIYKIRSEIWRPHPPKMWGSKTSKIRRFRDLIANISILSKQDTVKCKRRYKLRSLPHIRTAYFINRWTLIYKLLKTEPEFRLTQQADIMLGFATHSFCVFCILCCLCAALCEIDWTKERVNV